MTLLIVGYGKAIYKMLVNRLAGKETVESIIKKTEPTVLERIGEHLEKASIDGYPEKLIIAAFKEELMLQVYAMVNGNIKFIKEYPFTATSGGLGPKLKHGDLQIPEGIYGVEYFNPNSKYHLSIKVSYPNEFDRSKSTLGKVSQMGGDIFIHGKNVTVGCIPIGDEAIEEVFFLCQKANKEDIEIIISPRDFRLNASYPEIPEINWEHELYDQIKLKLSTIPLDKYAS